MLNIWSLMIGLFMAAVGLAGIVAPADVATVAQELQTVLRTEKRQAFLKTSGKTGLHVLVPWTAEGDYDEAFAAMAVGEM